MNTIHRIHPLIGILAAGCLRPAGLRRGIPGPGRDHERPALRAPGQRRPRPVPARASHRDRRRHARLADHPDRARCRLGRSHRGRGPGQGAGPPAAPPPRPPRDTRLTRPGRPPRLDPSSGPGAVPARQADVDSKHSESGASRPQNTRLCMAGASGESNARGRRRSGRLESTARGRIGIGETGQTSPVAATKSPSARTLPKPPGMRARRLSAGRRGITSGGQVAPVTLGYESGHQHPEAAVPGYPCCPGRASQGLRRAHRNPTTPRHSA